MSPQLLLPHRERTVRSKILKSTPAETDGRGGGGGSDNSADNNAQSFPSSRLTHTAHTESINWWRARIAEASNQSQRTGEEKALGGEKARWLGRFDVDASRPVGHVSGLNVVQHWG